MKYFFSVLLLVAACYAMGINAAAQPRAILNLAEILFGRTPIVPAKPTVQPVKPATPNNSICKDNICLTPGCIQTAAQVLQMINNTVKPCDDFYGFACGNFIKNTVIPDDKVEVSIFTITGDKLQEQLRTLIGEPAQPGESKPFTLAKDLYKACMNKSLIEQMGLKPVKELSDQLGGWPVVKGDQWDETKWDWVQATKDFRKLGFSNDYIIDFSVIIDLKKSTANMIDMDQSYLGMEREFLIKGLDDKLVKAYYAYMVDMAVIYGADRPRAEKELMDSLKFEMALANISLPAEQRRDINAHYNKYTIRDVQQKWSYIPWIEFINGLLPNGVQVDENEVINIYVPSFFDGLVKLLKETPKRAIANYLMWRMTSATTFYSNEEIRKRSLVYDSALSGIQADKPRWKECIDVTKSQLPISVGALYARKYFPKEAKKTAMELVNDTQAEFEKILKNVKWMDNTTRQAALKKLNAMTANIGYPDELMDDRKLEEYYKGVEVDPNEYLLSVFRIDTFDRDYSYNNLRKPVNKTDWVTHANIAVVNAFYDFLENSMQFPAGILQGQFFSADRPQYMNYGAIGYLIGHEITHGFDDQGSQFDLNGDLVDWWQPETKTEYLKRAQCIIEQYGNYTDSTTGLKLNGINTQGENIADNGGVKESYNAYKRWVQKNGPELKLPGLNYTPQQMVWLSAAQTWCSVYRTEYLRVLIETDVHSLDQFRIQGPFSNAQDFAKDFNCPAGSPMNPVKKCEVW